MQRLKGCMFLTLYCSITGVILACEAWALGFVNLKPLIDLRLHADARYGPIATVAIALVSPIAGAMLTDFFYYWTHRLQHTPLLWRFHAVHHSIRDLNAVNSFMHWTEELVRLPLVTLAAALLIRLELLPASPLIGLLVGLHSYYVHSPTRLNLGPLTCIFADNRTHRIHHSIEERHLGHNFGVLTTIWDRIFGTYWAPAPGEWPETGVEGSPEAQSIAEYLFRPFARSANAPVVAQESAASGNL